MSVKKIAAVIMHKPRGDSVGERLVDGGCKASSLDLISSLLNAGLKHIVVVTGDAEFSKIVNGIGAQAVVADQRERFHFGEYIKQVISERKLEGILYFSSGSGVLVDKQMLTQMVKFAARENQGALFNNFYSCDFAAISCAAALANVKLEAIDNSLGFSLCDAGFDCYHLPRDVATQFDIDTPTDLLLLARSGRGGKRLKSFLKQAEISHSHIDQVEKVLRDRESVLYLIGRLNPNVWASFEQEVACRTSAVAEGRGMKAYHSASETLVGECIDVVGDRSFLRQLSRVASAAIIDTRPLLASNSGQLPCAGDRYASDLLMPQLINDQRWMEFTRETIDIDIPVILGGHSLVSGGLYLLLDSCWKDQHLPRRLHPNPIGWTKE